MSKARTNQDPDDRFPEIKEAVEWMTYCLTPLTGKESEDWVMRLPVDWQAALQEVGEYKFWQVIHKLAMWVRVAHLFGEETEPGFRDFRADGLDQSGLVILTKVRLLAR